MSRPARSPFAGLPLLFAAALLPAPDSAAAEPIARHALVTRRNVVLTNAEQFAAFRDRLLAKSKLEFQASDKPVGRYTDRAGHTLQCVFDGPDKIDGAPADYAQWPVLDNPWMLQDAHGESLTVQSAGTQLVYDFTQGKRLTCAGTKP